MGNGRLCLVKPFFTFRIAFKSMNCSSQKSSDTIALQMLRPAPAACDFAACLSGSANDHRQWPSTVLASQDSKLVHCSCCFFLPTAPCKCMQNVMQNCEDTMRCHARLRLRPIGLRTLDPCLKTTRSTCIRPKDSRGTEASRRSVQKKSP